MTIQIRCKGADSLYLDQLEPFQGNLKDLSETNFKKLKQQILELGFSEPFSVWPHNGKFLLLNGHQRHRVLSKMKQEGVDIPKLPVNFVEASSVEEAKKKVLALTSQYGEITNQGLYEFMSESSLDFNLVENSFSFPEIDFELFKDEFFKDPEPETDPDEVLSTRPTTNIKIGDLFQLGEHRLLCGDCTVKKNIDLLLSGEIVDMVFTDPPYGMSVVKKNGQNNGLGESLDGVVCVAARGKYSPVVGDNTTDTAKSAYAISATLGATSMVFWGANFYAEVLPPSSGWIVWNKENGEGFFADGELAWTNSDKQLRIFKHQWKGMIRESERGEKRVHPTQKPIALAEWSFENYGKPKTVLDLFLGSGSTLIACEKTGRRCFGMEIDPIYCQVIIDRWEKYSGKKAVKV